MFDFFLNHKRVAQIVLALIFLPFALFGVERYFSSIGGGDYVAKVGSYEIGPQEFTRALRDEQEKMRSRAGAQFNPAILEDPEARAAILENLIRRHLALSDALHSGLNATDTQLQKIITHFEQFQENGKFSRTRYEALLRNQNLTPLGFEARLRQDIVLQQFNDAFDTGFPPQTVVDRLIRLSEQQREVSLYLLLPDQYMLQIKIPEEAARNYYEAHRNEFQIPEQVPRIDRDIAPCVRVVAASSWPGVGGCRRAERSPWRSSSEARRAGRLRGATYAASWWSRFPGALDGEG